MEGLHYLRYMLQQGDYMCKLDMKDAYFLVPLHRNCRDKVRFQCSGKLYEFLCLCFGLGPAPRIFTKILKVPISLIRRLNIRINSYLSRRHVVAGKVNQGGSDSNRHSDFLVATSRICNQPQKVHSDSPTKNRVFRSANGFSQHVIVFDSRETDESDQPMFGDVQDRESVHFTIEKAHRSLKFNSTSSVTCTTSVSVFTTNSNRIAQSRHLYQRQVTLNSSAKQELLWWVQNLKLCNGRCLVQHQA